MVPIGFLLGFSLQTSVLLGMVVSLSSTMVVLKTLSDRGELHSLHGRLLTGFLLVQDLAFVPMIAILPALNGGGQSVLQETGLGLLKAVIVLSATVLLGTRVIPWLMDRITRVGSREIFVLTVVATAFAIAAVTEYVGLSAALGAFVAGLMLSQSDFGHRALAEITPMKDIFAALFFASLGMLTDPMFVVENYVSVLAIVGSVLVLKFVITAGLVRGFGYLPGTALTSGFGMVQIGEFSFLLAAAALALGVVDQSFHSLVVVSAVITMAIAPAIIAGGSRAVESLGRRFRTLQPYRLGNPRSEVRVPHVGGHVIVCGLGRVGTLVARVLQEYGIPFIAVDLDPYVLENWKSEGYFTIHGSSGQRGGAASGSNSTGLDFGRDHRRSGFDLGNCGARAATSAGPGHCGQGPLAGGGRTPPGDGGAGGGLAPNGDRPGDTASFPLPVPPFPRRGGRLRNASEGATELHLGPGRGRPAASRRRRSGPRSRAGAGP